MIRCTACGYENRTGAKFCKTCGNALSDPQTLPGPTPASEAADTAPVLVAEHAAAAGLAIATLPVIAETVTISAAPVVEPLANDLLTTAQAVDRASPPETASDRAIPDADLPILPVGTILADRYWITDCSQTATGETLYQVEDHGVCRSCGAVATANAEEHYCFECGAHLLETALPWPTLRLRSVPLPTGAAPAPFLSEQGHYFERADEVAPPLFPTFTRGVHLLVGQRSDVGLLRTDRPDEDSIFTLTLSSIYDSQARPTLGLYLVADGMGGHGDGEVASRLAVETISAYLLQFLLLPALQASLPAALITSRLDEAIQLANQRIVAQAQAQQNEMGTTITLALVVDDVAYVANVGDSRTYHWHQGGLQQISEDHSAVYQLVKRGLLTSDEIYQHPRRNEILRSLGMAAPVRVDQFQVHLAPGNLLLLCCDGLWEMTRNEGIEEVLLQGYQDPQLICDELIRRANQAGGEDNISVVVVRIGA